MLFLICYWVFFSLQLQLIHRDLISRHNATYKPNNKHFTYIMFIIRLICHVVQVLDKIATNMVECF